MNMNPVISTNVGRVGYDHATRIMRVEFLGGGVYDYYGIPSGLFEDMLRPYPWRRLGSVVRAYPYRRVG